MKGIRGIICVFFASGLCLSAEETLLPLQLDEGWNFFSFPVPPVESDAAALLAGHLRGSVWSFDGRRYIRVTQLAANTGYCACVPRATVLFYPADVPTATPPRMGRRGWNLLCPSSPVDRPVQAFDGWWAFRNGRFVQVSKAVPGDACWVNLEHVEVLNQGDAAADADGDGCPDFWEELWGFSSMRADGDDDPDGDGLDNVSEYGAATNPLLPDSDGDGMPDGWEVAHGLDAGNDDGAGDRDGDGISNLAEYQAGRAPDSPEPMVTILSPRSGSHVALPGSVTFQIVASAVGEDVATVELLVNGTDVGAAVSGGGPGFTASWDATESGTFRITARAVTGTGESSESSPVMITLSPAIVVSPTWLAVNEGEADNCTVRLTAPPPEPLEVTVSADSPDAPLTVAAAALSFGPDTWQTPQQVHVTILADGNADDATAAVVFAGPGLLTASVVVLAHDPDYALDVLASPGGSTIPAGLSGRAPDSEVDVLALPGDGYVFRDWEGIDSAACTTNPLTVVMTGPRTLRARFVPIGDSDGDGLPDAWEQEQFGGLSADPAGDPDGDGESNLQELRHGTSPTAPSPLLSFVTGESTWPETAGTAVVTVAVTPPPEQTVTARVALRSGTATVGTDLVLGSAAFLSFTPEVPIRQIAIGLLPDVVPEVREHAVLELHDLQGALPGGCTRHVLWLVDDVAEAADTDRDGLPDAWEQQHFGSLFYGAHDDPDGDGFDNYTEFRLGMRPTVGARSDRMDELRLRVATPLAGGR